MKLKQKIKLEASALINLLLQFPNTKAWLSFACKASLIRSKKSQRSLILQMQIKLVQFISTNKLFQYNKERNNFIQTYPFVDLTSTQYSVKLSVKPNLALKYFQTSRMKIFCVMETNFLMHTKNLKM